MNSSLSNVPVNRSCLSIWNPSSGSCTNKQTPECDYPQMSQHLESWTFIKQTLSVLEMRKQNNSSSLICLMYLKYLLTSTHQKTAQHRLYWPSKDTLKYTLERETFLAGGTVQLLVTMKIVLYLFWASDPLIPLWICGAWFSSLMMFSIIDVNSFSGWHYNKWEKNSSLVTQKMSFLFCQ